MKRIVRNGRGISPVISTIILTSMILVMVLSTAYIDNDLLTNQVEDARALNWVWFFGSQDLTFTFTIDEVIKDEWTYDPNLNNETSDTVEYP